MDFNERTQIDHEAALAHWYYQAKFALLRRTLSRAGAFQTGAKLADLGCGLGVFLTLLERSHLLSLGQMIGIDPAAAGGQMAIQSSVPILRDWPEDRFDIVLLMDVLEHIDDAAAALRATLGHTKPGGYVFITVPAFPFLWSNHDVVLGHYRRYTRSSLGNLLAGFPELEVKTLHYFYGAIFPLAALIRLLRRGGKGAASDLEPASPLVNSVLKFALETEAPLARWNTLAGLTVTALCQKRE